MTDIVRFEFHGDHLEGIKQGKEVFFPLKPICSALGIDPKSQRDKLTGQKWAATSIIGFVAEDGRLREMFCIDRRTLLMWLTTMDANRVGEHVRPKLEIYQRDISDVIDRVFSGSYVPAPAPSGASVENVFAVCFERATEAILATVDARMARLLDERLKPQPAIGSRRAAPILARLRSVAKAVADEVGEADSAAFVRRCRSLLESELREDVPPFGRFEAMPEATVGQVLVRLEQLQRRSCDLTQLLRDYGHIAPAPAQLNLPLPTEGA
jgi:hypothetical protein